jgi:hypothetical protein
VFDVALGGRGYCWPTLPLTGSCKHVTIRPRGIREALQYTNVHSNFKIKFQTYIFEIIFKDNFLRLMFVYTTSNVYLTLRFKFEIYSTLLLIHGLIEIVLLMTNDNLYFCMI